MWVYTVIIIIIIMTIIKLMTFNVRVMTTMSSCYTTLTCHTLTWCWDEDHYDIVLNTVRVLATGKYTESSKTAAWTVKRSRIHLHYTQGLKWDGMVYQHFSGRFEIIPPILSGRLPYRYENHQNRLLGIKYAKIVCYGRGSSPDRH